MYHTFAAFRFCQRSKNSLVPATSYRDRIPITQTWYGTMDQANHNIGDYILYPFPLKTSFSWRSRICIKSLYAFTFSCSKRRLTIYPPWLTTCQYIIINFHGILGLYIIIFLWEGKIQWLNLGKFDAYKFLESYLSSSKKELEPPKENSFFIILLEGHQTYSVYLATIWRQDYRDLEAQ